MDEINANHKRTFSSEFSCYVLSLNWNYGDILEERQIKVNKKHQKSELGVFSLQRQLDWKLCGLLLILPAQPLQLKLTW